MTESAIVKLKCPVCGTEQVQFELSGAYQIWKGEDQTFGMFFELRCKPNQHPFALQINDTPPVDPSRRKHS
jgi:hypothetical protein